MPLLQFKLSMALLDSNMMLYKTVYVCKEQVTPTDVHALMATSVCSSKAVCSFKIITRPRVYSLECGCSWA